MPFKDYYATLEVPSTASAEEIRRSFHRLALKYHPDRNAGSVVAEERFKQINEAYQVLSDLQKRPKYDAFYRDHASAASVSSSDPADDHGDGSFHSHVEPVVYPCPATVQIYSDETGLTMEITPQSKGVSIDLVLGFFLFLLVSSLLFLALFTPVEQSEANVKIFWGLAWLGVFGWFFATVANFLFGKTQIVVNSSSIAVKQSLFSLKHTASIDISSVRMAFHDRAILDNRYRIRDVYSDEIDITPVMKHGISVIKHSFQEFRILDGITSDEADFIAQELDRFIKTRAV